MNETQMLTVDDVENIRKVREIMKNYIPADLNTDLNLRRWVREWRGELKEIEPRLKAYIENRKIEKLDEPDLLEKFRQNPIYSKYFKFFAFSHQTNVINDKDNCVIIIERVENVDVNMLTKVIPCGDFIILTFLVCETLIRQVLKQENISGQPSGMTVVCDMAGFNVMDFANPNAAIMKISKHCFALLQDYYCDMLNQIYIVNAPNFLTLMWSVIKLFIRPATQKKIVILGSNYVEELRERVNLDVLPPRYGGKQKDPTNGQQDPETCCTVPTAISSADFYVPRQIAQWSVEYLKPKATFEVRRTLIDNKQCQQFYWQYRVNSDVEFCVVRINEKTKQKQPLRYRFTFVTPKLPEEGSVICEEPGDYILEFRNISTKVFSLKLEYFAQIETPV